MHERQQKRLREKARREEQKRLELAQAETEGCTFKPDTRTIHSSRRSKAKGPKGSGVPATAAGLAASAAASAASAAIKAAGGSPLSTSQLASGLSPAGEEAWRRVEDGGLEPTSSG